MSRTSRRRFLIPYNGGECAKFIDPLQSRVALRLVQFGTIPFTSRYDLVQVVPKRVYFSPGDGPSPVQLPNSDVNLDGVVDERDLLQYMNTWILSQPPADFNLDDVIDLTDLSLFIQAYAEGE